MRRLLRDDASAILSRIKERGQFPFPSFRIIPQQRANEGEWCVFFSEKFEKIA